MRGAAHSLCLLLALASAAAGPARAADVEVTAAVTAASDYYFRGVSQTRNAAALQASVSAEHASGWFGGLFASTVDLPHGAYDSSHHHDVELVGHVGYGRDLGRGWLATAHAARYAYLDDPRYDYSELGVGLERHGISGTVSHSEHALGYAGPGTAWELVGRHALPARLTLSSGIGWYDLARSQADYGFWHVALQRAFGRLGADLGYFGSDEHGRRLFGDRARGRVVLSLSWGLL